VDAAVYQRDHAWANNLTNGDEQAYPNHIASFTKTLPHNQLGEVDSKAYAQLTRALDSGLDDDFAAIPLGGTVKLQDPQAAFCFDLFGADSHQLALPPPPAFASADIAGEITELYWQALTCDVPFAEYGTNSLVGQALDDLNRLSDFRGPKVNSRVTAGTLFRGLTPGDMKGPYVSQFLAKPMPFGAAQVVQQYRVPQSGLDYMTVFNEWLSVENGIPTGKVFTLDATSRYVRNGRDLAWWVASGLQLPGVPLRGAPAVELWRSRFEPGELLPEDTDGRRIRDVRGAGHPGCGNPRRQRRAARGVVSEMAFAYALAAGSLWRAYSSGDGG
jgi:hypothetical protein